MDREVWMLVGQTIARCCRRNKVSGRKQKYGLELIMKMYFWCVLHDRCLSWACDRTHYGNWFRPRKLPSISQFSRRVREKHFQDVLLAVHHELAKSSHRSIVTYMDGKPLPVSPVSKDRDAHSGHITGGFAKGYKLHAVVSECRKIMLWSVMPLNIAEQSVAEELSFHLPPAMPMALMLADGGYDSASLHKAMDRENRRLLTPLKGQKRVKNGAHHPVTLRQMGPLRREAVQLWKHHEDLARYILEERKNIEGVFSVLNVVLNMGHVPTWIRGLERVRRWAGAKIILYNARVSVQEKRAMPAENEHRQRLAG